MTLVSHYTSYNTQSGVVFGRFRFQVRCTSFGRPTRAVPFEPWPLRNRAARCIPASERRCVPHGWRVPAA